MRRPPRLTLPALPVLLALLTITGCFLVWLPVIPSRVFDPDELEHSHAAWSAFRGMLPYKDFFEHHTPWYYYVLRPFFNWFDVAGSFESARHFLLAGRALSFALAVASVALVWWMGRRWEDRRVAPVAALLLVSQPIFFQKMIEMRPDVLALPLFLGGLGLLLRALPATTNAAADTATDATSDAPRPSLRGFLLAGLAVGGAIMCTQKMLFVLPGTFGGLGLWTLWGGERAGTPRRLVATLAFVVAVGVPAALTWAAFAAHDAGGAFITNNFLLNAKWHSRPTHQLLRLLRTSGPVLALAAVGIGLALARMFRARRLHPRELLLAGVVVGVFLGLLVMPVAHRQYYLMALPIVCLFAAVSLLCLVDRLHGRKRAPLLVAMALGLAVLPVIAFVNAYRDGNDAQLAKIHHVFDTTAPTDLVMDGWEGMGVFRPHAYHHFFLHSEAVAMLPAADLDAYLTELETGAIRPRLIAMDENLKSLGPRFLTFVARNYVTTDGFFYYRVERGERSVASPRGASGGAGDQSARQRATSPDQK